MRTLGHRMRLVAFVAAWLAGGIPAFAQQPSLRETVRNLPPSRILFSETIHASDGTVLGGETGTLEVQYPCFHIVRGTILLYGDGKTIWNYDTENQEVLILSGEIDALFGDSRITVNADEGLVTLHIQDGEQVVYRILSVETMEESWPLNHFVLDTSKLDAEVIVSDLRKK